MGYWKDPKTKKWKYLFQFLGRTYSKRGFETKKDAMTARVLRQNQLSANPEQTTAVTVFKDAAYIYLDYAERRFADKTFRYKRYVLSKFNEFLERQNIAHLPIDQITPHMVHAYLNTRSSNYNYNFHRKDLSAMFAYAVKKLKILKTNPCADIDKMPHQSKKPEIPSKETVMKFLAAAKPKIERPLILTVLLTAARIDEVLRLKWSDIDFDNGTLTRYTRKRSGGNYAPITIKMNQDLLAVIQGLWDRRTQEEWVFFNKRTKGRFKHRPRMMAGISARAKIDPPIRWHLLRHFMATYLYYDKGSALPVVGNLLGHMNLSTTELYFHRIESSETDALISIEGDFEV